MLIFVVGFGAVATSRETRPEPQPDKIGIKIMTIILHVVCISCLVALLAFFVWFSGELSK